VAKVEYITVPGAGTQPLSQQFEPSPLYRPQCNLPSRQLMLSVAAPTRMAFDLLVFTAANGPVSRRGRASAAGGKQPRAQRGAASRLQPLLF